MHKRKRARRNHSGENPTRRSERVRFERAMYIIGASNGLYGDLRAMNAILNAKEPDAGLRERIEIAQRNASNYRIKRAARRRSDKRQRKLSAYLMAEHNAALQYLSGTPS